ncbi:hypothetical protein BCR36DRAFT_293202 [Piromyces finnis]|uniref:Uncharacterized protein n=1 Tax=Piromyces finnis TaxID=1754191 RepID=A0A1Y1V6X5_9FUNG|nr:hypothetical protein BCR36DRAFT_293202 [Piromyces finnis]|eukprot:ORX48694.1 hypothetical protein BCR36DRAFT_293202 [Piromyces finnis]
MNNLKSCEYSNTNLCYLSNEKCKSTLKECTSDQINDTDNQLIIQNNKEQLQEGDEGQTIQEGKHESIKDEIYNWLYRPYIFAIIVAVFVIIILLLFCITKKCIKHKYEKKLKMSMEKKQYFVNHSIKHYQNQNNDKTNVGDFSSNDENNHRSHNDPTTISDTRSNINNYQPIYQDNLTIDSQQENNSNVGSHIISPNLSPANFQIPAMAYASLQHRSTVTSQFVNNGDYYTVDQGGNFDSHNSRYGSSSYVNLNNGQFHNTRSRPRTRPRSNTGGHSPVNTSLSQYNINRYSYSGGGMLYSTTTSNPNNNRNNRHSIGIYSNVNSYLTSHSGGNISNYGTSEPGSVNYDDNDYSNENGITYTITGKSNPSITEPKNNQNKNVVSKQGNTFTRNTDAKDSDKDDDDDDDGSSSSSFVAKLNSSEDDDSDIDLPNHCVARKTDNHNIAGDDDSDHDSGNDSDNEISKDIEEKDHYNEKSQDEIGHSISMEANNGHDNASSSEENITEIITTPTTSTLSTPNTLASSNSPQPLSKAELAKRESTYIKNHKRKIPIYKSRTIRVNSVVRRDPTNNPRRRHSLQYVQHPLSYSNKNSLSMTNLVQLNNPSVFPLQNANFNSPVVQGIIPSNESYLYEASTSNNYPPHNSIIYRSKDSTSIASKRAKHQSMISIGSNGHPSFYIADEVNGSSPVYSNSLRMSKSLNPIYVAPLVSPTGDLIQTKDGGPSYQIQHHPQINVQDQSDQELSLIRNDSSTNISNLLSLINDSSTSLSPPPPIQDSMTIVNRKQSIPNSNVNSNADSNSSIIAASATTDRMNIYPTNGNVSGVPLAAFSINGVTYVPAGTSTTVNVTNPSPSNGSAHVNRNSTLISPNNVFQVPIVNNNNIAFMNNINMSPPNSPAHSVHSPILSPPSISGQPIMINTNSPRYGPNQEISLPGISPSNSPLIQPAVYCIPNVVTPSNNPSPHLASQSLPTVTTTNIKNKEEVVCVEDQGQESRDSNAITTTTTRTQNVPEIILNSATNESSELSALQTPDPNSLIYTNTNESLGNRDSVNHLQDIYFDEVIEVPGSDHRILRRSIYLDNDDEIYNPILNDSTITNLMIDNHSGPYVSYNYPPTENITTNIPQEGEVEFYYEDTEDEAPPPYSDTFQ